jgi:hypothetical protein
MVAFGAVAPGVISPALSIRRTILPRGAAGSGAGSAEVERGRIEPDQQIKVPRLINISKMVDKFIYKYNRVCYL